ncbi:hypothetical protein SHPE106448_04305 [Shewanella pealeana]
MIRLIKQLLIMIVIGCSAQMLTWHILTSASYLIWAKKVAIYLHNVPQL